MDIKTQIAPKGLEFRPSSFVASDKYSTIMTVISYPKVIAPGFLANLTSMSGIKMVIKHIPLPFSVITKMVNKEIADLKVRYQEEHDVTIQERLRQDYESLEEFIKQLAASQSRIFDFQLHLMITADSDEELTSKKLQLRGYLEAMNMRAIPLRFEQEKVLKSMLPIFPKQDIEDRIGTPIPSPTIAAMYPFVFDSIKDPGLSTLLGVDFSGGVVLFNQFLYQVQKEHNRNNANMIILGTSGSGKSTAAKLLLRNHIRNGYKLVVIDPEGELEDMTRLYGGDFIDLGKGGEFGMINPLEVVIDADEDETPDKVEFQVDFSAEAIPEIDTGRRHEEGDHADDDRLPQEWRFQDGQRDADSQRVDARRQTQSAKRLRTKEVYFRVLVFFLQTVAYHFASQIKEEEKGDPMIERFDEPTETKSAEIARDGHPRLEKRHDQTYLHDAARRAMLQDDSAGYRHGQTVHRQADGD